jgi:hypothetical protein
MLGHLLKSSSIKGRSVLLLPFIYLGQKISVVSSYVFTHDSTKTERSQNDKNNKMREAIIGAIINNRVPPTYYLTERWRNLKQAVVGFLQTCSSSTDDTTAAATAVYSHVECIPAAGRGHNYDFTIVFTNSEGVSTTHHVEFKFNAAKVSDTPQFVSPMKPSQYLSGSYEEYFYDKYMPIIASMAAAGSTSTSTTLPDRAEWLKQIHNNAPACVKHLQAKYYAGCNRCRRGGDHPSACKSGRLYYCFVYQKSGKIALRVSYTIGEKNPRPSPLEKRQRNRISSVSNIVNWQHVIQLGCIHGVVGTIARNKFSCSRVLERSDNTLKFRDRSRRVGICVGESNTNQMVFYKVFL